MKKLLSMALILIMVFSLGGCGEDSEKTSSSKDVELSKMTAEEIINEFVDAGYPIENVQVYTEKTDPNSIMGTRDDAYTGKVSFADSRIPQMLPDDPDGGTVEVFKNNSDAKTRYDYLDSLTGILSAESTMLLKDNVVFRVSDELTKEQKQIYIDGFNNMSEGNHPKLTSNQQQELEEKAEGDIGKYHIAIKEYDIKKDNKDYDSIIVKIEYKNNSDGIKPFDEVCSVSAKQGSENLDSTYISDYGYSSMDDVKPDESKTVEKVFRLYNTELPVKIMISEDYDSNIIISKTFEIQ